MSQLDTSNPDDTINITTIGFMATKNKKKTYRTKSRNHIPRWTLWAIVSIVALVGIFVVYQSFASSTGTGSTYRFKPLSSDKFVRTWKMATVYNLDTGQKIGNVSAFSEFEVNGVANFGNAVFLALKQPTNTGQRKGIYINTAFALTRQGQPIFNGQVTPERNKMPLTSQSTSGGDCTASKVWHQGLNNNLIKAVQRVQLQLNTEVPMVTAYRSYSEQSCLYSKYAGTSQPVAAPGTSRHESGLAIDVNRDWLNGDNRRQAFRENGLCENVAGDPGHYELCGSSK